MFLQSLMLVFLLTHITFTGAVTRAVTLPALTLAVDGAGNIVALMLLSTVCKILIALLLVQGFLIKEGVLKKIGACFQLKITRKMTTSTK